MITEETLKKAVSNNWAEEIMKAEERKRNYDKGFGHGFLAALLTLVLGIFIHCLLS